VLLDQPAVLPCMSPSPLCILEQYKLRSAIYTICSFVNPVTSITSITIQKHHSYVENLNSETSKDSQKGVSTLGRCLRSANKAVCGPDVVAACKVNAVGGLYVLYEVQARLMMGQIIAQVHSSTVK